MAVHQSAANKLLHWCFIPCQIFASYLFFTNCETNFSCGTYRGVEFPLNLSMCLLVSMVVLYLRMDLTGGCLALLMWCPLLHWANYVHQNHIFPYEMVSAIGIFVLALALQVGVGHHIFEGGRDDTKQNLAELCSTWNPIYIACIPFYHIMEIVFLLELKPSVFNDVCITRRHN